MLSSFALRGGKSIPAVGLGLWKSAPGEVADSTRSALELGVRLLDGAAAYGNEKEVGGALAGAIKDGVVKREDVFVVSKLFNTKHVWDGDVSRINPAFEQTLKDLQVDYLDLYLMHWPFAFQQEDLVALGGLRGPDGTPNPKLVMRQEFVETYGEMVKLLKSNRCRAIGVCNFTQAQLDVLLAKFPEHPPSINQCELHPYLSQPDLKAFCDEKGIVMMAYSPLGSGDSYSGKSFPAKGNGPYQNPNAGSTLLQNEVVGAIASRLGKSPAQVLIRWSIQRGVVCIPKSVRRDRIQENSSVLDWNLPDDDMSKLDALNCGFRYGIGYEKGHYDCPNSPWYVADAKRACEAADANDIKKAKV